jgi:hypothetical protein
MAKIPHLIPATGTIDGINTTFTVPSSFFPIVVDSETFFVRGLPRRRDNDDGWAVTDYSTGTFDLNEAPLPGDDVEIMFLQDIGVVPEAEITPIKGCVRPLGQLTGAVSTIQLTGCLVKCED